MPTNEEMYDAADRLKDQGKQDEAIAKLEELLTQDNTYTLAHRALAVLCGRANRHEDAIRHALTACQQEPNDPFSYTALSVTYQRAGRIQEAEDAKAQAHTMAGHRH
ncbi:MAG TPA: tetratricopeptide repeat protein [Pirellulales bacterium]